MYSDGPQPVGILCVRLSGLPCWTSELESNVHVVLTTKPRRVLLAHLNEVVIHNFGKVLRRVNTTHLTETDVSCSEIVLHFFSAHSRPQNCCVGTLSRLVSNLASLLRPFSQD